MPIGQKLKSWYLNCKSLASTIAIIIIALVLAVATSIGYYQFFYIQKINERPTFVDGTGGIAEIRIVEGASSPANPEYIVPRVATVVIGVNNTVRWVSEDTIPHGITSDTGYKDPFTGKPFDIRTRSDEEGGPFLMPGKTYEFTFREPGEYGYHGEPHPWMQGTVIVIAK